MRRNINVGNPALEEFSRQRSIDRVSSDGCAVVIELTRSFHKLPIGIRRKHPDTPGTVDFGSEFVAQLLPLNVYCR
ncbi:unnamed protein product [Lasius platythorax]|uniref:Uncharacterized protein n=1 Tax=Lasius platythorax TaxID=488582 RepID=A0AAV2P0D1_9HYME